MSIRLCQLLFSALIIWACPSNSDQTESDNQLLSDLTFDEDFLDFNDDEFDEKLSSWQDNFVIRVSHQVFGQINSHQVEPIPDLKIPKTASVENHRTGINVRYQNAIAPGWLVQGSWQGRIYWKEDYEYEANNNHVEDEYRVNELFVQKSTQGQSFKLGRQIVVWGETVGNSVLDVINHNEFRDFTIIDVEDTRLNQWMLLWDVFDEAASWSTFINLYPEFNPRPVRGGPFDFDLGYEINTVDRGNDPIFEVGSQWRKSYGASDVSIMAAYLYENQLRYEGPTPFSDKANPIKNDYILIGFSANRAIGKLLLTLDVALKRGVLIDGSSFVGVGSFNTPTDLKKDQVGMSLGFEYGITNYQTVSLGIQLKKMKDERLGLSEDQILPNQGIYGSWLFRYANRLKNDDLELSATLQGDLKGDAALFAGNAAYKINDNWTAGLQILTIHASGTSELQYFTNDVRLGAALTYSF